MPSDRRKANYFAQNASQRLTPRQRRRWAKKAVALGDWSVDDALTWLSTKQRDAGPVRANARVRVSPSAECGCTPELVLSDCPVHVTDEICEALPSEEVTGDADSAGDG